MNTIKLLVLPTLGALAGCGLLFGSKPEVKNPFPYKESASQCAGERRLYVKTSATFSPFNTLHDSYCIPTFPREDMQAEASLLSNDLKFETPDYTLIASRDGSVRYYFTKPSFRLYPWSVKIIFPKTAAAGKSSPWTWVPGYPKYMPIPDSEDTGDDVAAWLGTLVR
jgi:hypothetical protein